MENFLTLLVNVFSVGIFPLTFMFFIFQNMKTKEGQRKVRFATSVGFVLTLIISLLIFFVPGIDIFLESIAGTWTGSLWDIFRTYGIITLTFIWILIQWKNKEVSTKWILFSILGFSVIMNMIILLMINPGSSINEETYYFERLDLEQLWTYSTGYTQTIAIIDSGITDEALMLFQYHIVSVYNSIDGSHHVRDDNEVAHGTQMASIILGTGEYGVYGIAPGAQAIIIRAFEGLDSQTNIEALSRAIHYAIEQEVDIISMSFGSFQANETLEQTIERAIEAGITVVAAVGDDGHRDSLFPARMDGVVSVRARDDHGNFWQLSNLGDNDVMSMYGVHIRSLTFNNESIEATGTSQATALAAGYIALIRGYYLQNGIELSNDELIELLIALESTVKTDVDFLLPFRQLEYIR